MKDKTEYQNRTVNRERHKMKVAEIMQYYAKILGWKNHKDMYVLGLLHDIWYAITEKEKHWKKHSKEGGKILKKNGYKYWKEVYYHGDYKTKYWSEELELLNLVDMQVNPKGKFVGFKGRMQRIYNTKSDEIIKDCEKMIEKLKNGKIYKKIKAVEKSEKQNKRRSK